MATVLIFAWCPNCRQFARNCRPFAYKWPAFPANCNCRQTAISGNFGISSNFRQFLAIFCKSGNFHNFSQIRQFPAISGNYQQFLAIFGKSGNFWQFLANAAIFGNFRQFRQCQQIDGLYQNKQNLINVLNFPNNAILPEIKFELLIKIKSALIL